MWQVLVSKDDDIPEQQEWNLDQQGSKLPHIKEEQRELWRDDEEKPESSQFRQSQTDKSTEVELHSRNSTLWPSSSLSPGWGLHPQNRRTLKTEADEDSDPCRFQPHCDVLPEQQEWNQNLDRQGSKLPHIKMEQREVWSGDEEKPQSSQLCQRDERTEVELNSRNSTFWPPSSPSPAWWLHPQNRRTLKTEADGDDCEGSQPARDSDPCSHFHPHRDDQTPAEPDEHRAAGEPAGHQAEQAYPESPVKRLRLSDEWKSTQRKTLRNTGKCYTGKKGEIHEARKMKELPNHKCIRQCSTISEDERKKLFEQYWALGDYNAQISWLCSTVKQVAPKRRYVKGDDNNQPRKGYTRVFYFTLQGRDSISVCKTFFLATLGISNGVLDRALTNQRKHDGIPTPDKRGMHSPPNKLPTADVEYVKQHILCFPRYSRHTREVDRKFLSPELNLRIMYSLYVQKCKDNERQPVKEWAYRNIFNTKFNLGFHPTQKDTCKVCERLQIQIDAMTADERGTLVTEKELHLRKAEKARTCLRIDTTAAKHDQTLDVITFDLQKPLPTPMLPTNEVHYKRQLSVYNLGIHSQKEDVGHMYMWHEGQASRGANEVGSCLLHYCKQAEQRGIRRITAYSDSCGRQNRNYKMALMWMHIVSTLNVEVVDHKLLDTGHGYLPIYQDFGLVDKAKRKKQHIFVPDEWYDVVRQAKRKEPHFIVVPMTADMFHSTAPLEEATVIRKLDEDSKKVEWLKMQWMQFRKSDVGLMFYKTMCDDAVPFHTVDFKQRGSKMIENITELPVLYPRGKPLKKAKHDDIKSLLKYVPPIHHPFYESLSAIQVNEVGDHSSDGDSD